MANKTNYTDACLIGSKAPEVRIFFCSLNEPLPSTNLYNAGKYSVTFVLGKNSESVKELLQAYKNVVDFGRKIGVNVPLSNAQGFFLKDGDKYNANRIANGKEAVELYKNSCFFTVVSKYQPVMYDNKAQYAFATDNAGRQIIVDNRQKFYLSNLDGSYVQFVLRFNVGESVKGAYAKPYLDWVMQVKAGASAGPSIAPTIPTWGREANGDNTSISIAPNIPINDLVSNYDDGIEASRPDELDLPFPID